jgi:hypothetical protein
MEILTGVLCFLQIVDLLFKVKDKVTVKEDKESLHQYLKSVGLLLREVAEDFERNMYPHDKCMQMFTHMNYIKTELSGKISEEQLSNLSNLIEQSYRVEQLFGELQNLSEDQKNKNIVLIKTASGAFIATADLIKL